MESQPLVSIGIMCYNHEKYVREALESVINQTYPNIDILISDDGSTDGTRSVIQAIIRENPDKVIRTFFAETNTAFGIVEEMASQAAGQYYMALGGDDFLGDTAVARYVNFLEDHTEYAALFSVPEIVCERTGGAVIPDFEISNASRYEMFEFLFCGGNRICAPSMCIRRNVWEEMGGYRYQYRQLQDYELWLKILQKYDIYILQKGMAPVYYRIHENNISRQSDEVKRRGLTEMAYMLWRIMEEMDRGFFIQAFKKHLLYPIGSERFCAACEKFMVLLHARVVPLQSALFYYFSHVEDADFHCHIEADYKFGRKKFYELTGRKMEQNVIEVKQKEMIEKQFSVIDRQNQLIEKLLQKIEQIQA